MTHPEIINWLTNTMRHGRSYAVTPEQAEVIKELWPVINTPDMHFSFNEDLTRIKKYTNPWNRTTSGAHASLSL